MPVTIPDFPSVGFDDPRAAGGWPNFPANDASAEGLMVLGKGIEKAGTAAADIGAMQEYKRQRLNEANATTDLFNRMIPLHAQIAKETDPEKLAQLKAQYDTLLPTSSQAIDDPLRRQMWIANHSKTIVQAHAEADTRSTVLYRQGAIANGLNNIDAAVRNAVNADDPNAFANGKLAIGDNLRWMGESGALDPEHARVANKQAQKQLIEGRVLRLTDQGKIGEAQALLEQNYAELDPITHGNLSLRIEGKGRKINTDGAALRALGLPTIGIGGLPSGMSSGGAADQVDNWETRNNNFGGMRKVGVPAAGPNAGGFQSFNSPEEGVAAISRQLDRYASGATTGAPLTTLRQIVSTWAPPNENDTPALIARASKITGFAPDQVLDVGNSDVKAKLIEATIRNEQGGKLPVDPQIIAKVAGVASQPIPSGEAAPAQSSSTAPQNRTGLPSLAEAYQNILRDPAIKTDAEVRNAFATATAIHNQMEADAARTERIQTQAHQQQVRDAENEAWKDVYSATPKITASQVAVDPRYNSNPERRKQIIDLINNPPGSGIPAAQSYAAAQTVIDRIRLPYGDPNKITTRDQIYDLKNVMNRADVDYTLKKLDELSSPGDQPFSHRLEEFFRGVTPQIDKSGALPGLPTDSKGKAKAFEFRRMVESAAEDYRKAGKNPDDLINPKSSAYLGNPENLKPYKRTPTEALADFTAEDMALGGKEFGATSAIDIGASKSLADLQAMVKRDPSLRDRAIALSIERGWIMASPPPAAVVPTLAPPLR